MLKNRNKLEKANSKKDKVGHVHIAADPYLYHFLLIRSQDSYISYYISLKSRMKMPFWLFTDNSRIFALLVLKNFCHQNSDMIIID